jgi:hypothetical protein
MTTFDPFQIFVGEQDKTVCYGACMKTYTYLLHKSMQSIQSIPSLTICLKSDKNLDNNEAATIEVRTFHKNKISGEYHQSDEYLIGTLGPDRQREFEVELPEDVEAIAFWIAVKDRSEVEKLWKKNKERTEEFFIKQR